jgi:hypothetical protein
MVNFPENIEDVVPVASDTTWLQQTEASIHEDRRRLHDPYV